MTEDAQKDDVPLSHFWPDHPVKQWQRNSPFLSSQRTVPLGLQGDGEHWSGISENEGKPKLICTQCISNIIIAVSDQFLTLKMQISEVNIRKNIKHSCLKKTFWLNHKALSLPKSH